MQKIAGQLFFLWFLWKFSEQLFVKQLWTPASDDGCSFGLYLRDLFRTYSHFKKFSGINKSLFDTKFTLEQTITHSWVNLLEKEIVTDCGYTRF